MNVLFIFALTDIQMARVYPCGQGMNTTITLETHVYDDRMVFWTQTIPNITHTKSVTILNGK